MDKIQLNICIPLYNRCSDITNLLYKLEKIYSKIDSNILKLNVIITDFNSDDINLEKLKPFFSFDINIINLNQKFNIAIGIKTAADTVKDGIIFIIDADTEFSSDFNLIELCKLIEEGKNFYNPIIGCEAFPNNWECKYDEKNNFYIPKNDHGGSGMLLCYSSDWHKINCFNNSEFLGKRGEKWGGHDTCMTQEFKKYLQQIRDTRTDVWLRKNNREGEWYATCCLIYK